VTPCLSSSTFQPRCGNLPRDAVESRSKTQLQRWRTPCPHSGQFIQASEIVSQPSKDRCGNTSTFLSARKTRDIRVDSRLPSRPDRRFRSSLLSVADARAVRCPIDGARRGRNVSFHFADRSGNPAIARNRKRDCESGSIFSWAPGRPFASRDASAHTTVERHGHASILGFQSWLDANCSFFDFFGLDSPRFGEILKNWGTSRVSPVFRPE
jgi:hypothetical protein